MSNCYELPNLPYGYGDLIPFLSVEQLTFHHQKHHQAYVEGANAILEKLENAREQGAEIDMKSTLKELSFYLGGHLLHSLFWENIGPKGGGEPKTELASRIKKDFGSFERFKKEFSQTAISVEGSGWAALVHEPTSSQLLIMQIEKHNLNLYPNGRILLVLDVWEHAYYLDYKNERAKYVETFWNFVDWAEIEKKFHLTFFNKRFNMAGGK